jgi:hypothetical protein
VNIIMMALAILFLMSSCDKDQGNQKRAIVAQDIETRVKEIGFEHNSCGWTREGCWGNTYLKNLSEKRIELLVVCGEDGRLADVFILFHDSYPTQDLKSILLEIGGRSLPDCPLGIGLTSGHAYKWFEELKHLRRPITVGPNNGMYIGVNNFEGGHELKISSRPIPDYPD